MRSLFLRTLFSLCCVTFLVACGGSSTPKTHRQVIEKVCINLINAEMFTNRNQCGLAEEFTLEESFGELFAKGVDRDFLETGMEGFPLHSNDVIDCNVVEYRNCEEKNPTRVSYVIRERSSNNFTEIFYFTFENNELADITFEKE